MLCFTQTLMILKQVSCFPNLLPLLLPTIAFNTVVPSTLLSENLLISCGRSWIGVLSSSSSITSHVSCQGNHLTESTIKDSSDLFFFSFAFRRATEMSSCIRAQVPIFSLITSYTIWKQSLFTVRDESGEFDKPGLWNLAEVNAIETACICSLKGKIKIWYLAILIEFSAMCPVWSEWGGWICIVFWPLFWYISEVHDEPAL